MEQEPQGNSLKEYFVDIFLCYGTASVMFGVVPISGYLKPCAIMVIISTTCHLFNS